MSERLQDVNEPLFRKKQGVCVEAITTLEKVFRKTRSAVQAERTLHTPEEVFMGRQQVRLIPNKQWLQQRERSPKQSIRRAVGLYEPKEDACFVPYNIETAPATQRVLLTRWQAAKVMVHEIVHLGSKGGIYKFSELLNEGITEMYARHIFGWNVQCAYPHITEDPYQTYGIEVSIWKEIFQNHESIVAALKRAFWRGDSDEARDIVQSYFGPEICMLMEGEEKTAAEKRKLLHSIAFHGDPKTRITMERAHQLIRVAFETMSPEDLVFYLNKFGDMQPETVG